MKKKTKFIIEAIIFAVILLAIALAIILALINPTRTYDAVVERNGTQKEATLTLRYNLLARCVGRLSGTLTVETADGLSRVEYNTKELRIFAMDKSEWRSSGYVMGSIWVEDEADAYGGGYFYVDIVYDKNFDNIAICGEEDDYIIYSATDEFLKENWWRVEDCFKSAETE